MNIFVSYSSKDRDLVTLLTGDLEALGHEPWFDPELARAGGQKWWSNILAHIRTCDLFIFALTPDSLASEPCKREYSYANALCKRIVPVMLTGVDVTVLPVALQEIQFVDYRERSSKQGIALSSTLSNLPPAQPAPDPLPPEPDTPLTPVARLSERIDAPSLSSSQQIEIVFELETLFHDAATRGGAETLLRKLYAHDDLTNRVADRIRQLIPDINARPSAPLIPNARPPEAASPGQTRKPEVVTSAPQPRNRGRLLSSYLLLPIPVSLLILVWGFLSPFGIVLHVIAVILSFVGVYGTRRWKKWGIYVLILDILAGAGTFALPYRLNLVSAITFFGVAAILGGGSLWFVLRNKWAWFD